MRGVNVATYNVKRFEMKNQKSVLDLLIAEQIDVCGLQEVPGKTALLTLFSDTKYQCVYLGPYHTYGLGLVYNKDVFKLAHSKLHMLKNGQNKKAALEVALMYLNTNEKMTFFITHLDHKTEPQRMEEIKVFLSLQKEPNQHFLLGDFNALKRSDYNEAEWERIVNDRKKVNWEPPQLDVIKEIEQSGYVDLVLLGNAVAPTSRFDTRVDYIFSSPGLAARCIGAKTVDSDINQSDHKLVLVHFF